MQSYIVNICKKNKTNYFLSCLKNIQISNYFINLENIKINFDINQNNYSIIIYFNKNFKPNFTIVESSEDNIDLNSMIENLNSYIDDYDNIYDIVYEIKKIINEFVMIKNITIKSTKIKDIKLFTEKLEIVKNNYVVKKDNNYSSELFSYRSLIEMLGDQILKIHMDDRFEIDNSFENLEKIIVNMQDFTFGGSEKLEVKVCMDINLNWIKFPPNISLKSNMLLEDNILSVIEKLKPFSDTKLWSIKYSIYETISNIHLMINTYGAVKFESPNILEVIITELEHLFSLKNKEISSSKLLELFDKNLLTDANKGNSTNKNQNVKEFWKKGTGYGHENNSNNQWNIEEYVININNKKKNINIKFSEFLNILTNKLTSIVDLQDRILQLFEQYINFDEQDLNYIIKIGNILHSNPKIFSLNEKSTVIIIKYLKQYFEENNIDHPLIAEPKVNSIIKNIGKEKLDEYQKPLYDYRFRFINSEYSNFYYDSNSDYDSIPNSSSIIKNSTINSIQITRLQKEYIILKKSITIDKDASIFFSVDKSSIFKMRFIISGPKDTPYSYGLFIFDMTLSNEFPQKPPLVHFINHGNKRFNPNLYDSGKVCLSLLGTWNTSNKGESWNSSLSTFNQILISIQSLILIDEPYFNEPGYEKYIGTPNGKEKSKNYNYSIKKYTLDHTINDLIDDLIIGKNNYKEFDNVIKNHFKFHKNNIKKQNELWYNDLPETQKKSFKSSMDKFDHIIDIL